MISENPRTSYKVEGNTILSSSGSSSEDDDIIEDAETESLINIGGSRKNPLWKKFEGNKIVEQTPEDQERERKRQ